MIALERLRIQRKTIGKGPSTALVQVRLDDGFVSLFQDTRRKLKKLTGKKLTRAYILREGGRNLLRQLCVQIAKAEQGTLHAKPRTNGAQ